MGEKCRIYKNKLSLFFSPVGGSQETFNFNNYTNQKNLKLGIFNF